MINQELIEIKKFCTDSQNTLDKRWKSVQSFGDITHSTNFGIPEIDIILDNNWLYFNRWETYSVGTILQMLNGFEWDELNCKFDEDKFKEYCCQNFIGKMQYSKFLSI